MVGFYYHNYTFVASPSRARPGASSQPPDGNVFAPSADIQDSYGEQGVPSTASRQLDTSLIHESNQPEYLRTMAEEDGAEGQGVQEGDEYDHPLTSPGEEGEAYDEYDEEQDMMLPISLVPSVQKDLRHIDAKYARAWKPVPKGLCPKGVSQLNVSRKVLNYVQHRKEHGFQEPAPSMSKSTKGME